MSSVAIVICNHNKKDFVLKCIETVFVSSFMDFDLIVVDNASTDGSAEAIRDKYGDRLTLLVNKENTGGSGGFNRGMQFALDKGGYKYIQLLDDDVEVDKDAVGALYRFMEEHPDAGACGSLICRMQAREFVQDFGANIDLEHIGVLPVCGGQTIADITLDFVSCDYVAACSAMFRADALERHGVIDREFFIYWDDMALCWELRLAGYNIYAHSKSIVWHNGSYGARNALSRYYSLRNKIYCFTRYLKDGDFARFKEILLNMMFRTFAVNRDNPGFMENYFHGLNDALNGIRGKAEDYKIQNAPAVNEKFRKVIDGKRRILVILDENVPEYDRVLERIRLVSDAHIDTCEGDSHTVSDYDIVVQLCYHILDEPEYDRSKVYIDKYANQIMDSEDFDFYENLEINRSFFNDTFGRFIFTKLDVLREQIGRACDGG